MVAKISEASVAVTATPESEISKPTNIVKTKDGAIEALCKAGNFDNFDK